MASSLDALIPAYRLIFERGESASRSTYGYLLIYTIGSSLALNHTHGLSDPDFRAVRSVAIPETLGCATPNMLRPASRQFGAP